MRSREDLKALLEVARELGVPWVEVDGVKLPIPALKVEANPDPETPQIFADPTAEYTDEELLYYATPYFDELQAIKAAKKKHAEEESQFRRTT